MREDDGDEQGNDGRRKSLTSRMFGMRSHHMGTYDQSRKDGVGEDGKVDIVGERCRALADAAMRIADTLRAEPKKTPEVSKSKRNFLRKGEIARDMIIDDFLGTSQDDGIMSGGSQSPGGATECEPTPHMQAPSLSPPDRDTRGGFQNAQTPVQSHFIAAGGGGMQSPAVRYGGGGGSAALSPVTAGPGGHAPEYNIAATLGGAGRLPPADLDQRGQPLGPPSPDNILRELAAQLATLRDEVVTDREAQRHEAHVRQVGLLTDASVKVPGRTRSSPGKHQRSMKGIMDPVWNEQSLASSRAASTLSLEGADVSHRLRNLTDRVGQLYAEVHHGAGKCLCRYMPEGMACSYCLESKAEGFASTLQSNPGAGRAPQ